MNYKKLIKGCKENNRRSQQKLFLLIKDKMMGICLRYANEKAEAEDILQESFIKIFNKIDCLQEPEKLESWARKIFINTAINHYHKPHNKYENKEIKENINEDHHYTHIIENLDNHKLVDLVNQLPHGYRLVFNMYVIDGYTHQEIAEALNISINTSKSQLHAAKQTLKKKLGEMGIYRYEKI
ncbi:MAG: RNA polymerase sigma factor [Cyclobacteriaceae bacterium]